MLAELQTIDTGDVTLTQSMIILGVVPMVIVQLFRAVIDYFWPAGPQEIKKPMFSLVGISTAVLIFYALAAKDWLMGGIIIGFAAGGGYDFAKHMGGIVKKATNGNGNKPPLVPAAVLLLCAMLIAGGCSQVQMSPQYRQQLLMSNALVQSLNGDCQAGDPNACRDGLNESAKTLQKLVDAVDVRVLKGGDGR